MVEIKRGDNGKGRGSSVSAVNTIQSKKKILFGIVFVMIILLIGVVFFINKFSAVGQAVHTQFQAPLSLPSGGSAVVWTDFVSATAAEPSVVNSIPVYDVVHIPIHLKTAYGVKVDKFTFKVVYDTDKLSLDATALGSNLPTASSGFQFMGSSQDVLNDIINGQNVDMVALSQGVTGANVVIADIAFIVKGKANTPFTEGSVAKITFNFVSAGYLDSNGNPVTITLDPSSMDVNIIIYPACQDADGDGYGNGGSDNRGCVHNLPTDIDCDDISSDDPEICKSGLNCNDVTYAGCATCINPGAKEVCDGINNDCSSVIDDSVGEGTYNDNIEGVCYGYKICRGKDGWKNSYEVTDKTLNTQTFFDASTEFSQVDLYVPPIVDASTGKVTGPGVEKCDLFDNNCNGKVNEGITCSLSGGGGIPKGLLPVGNVFVDYDVGGEAVSPQILNQFDSSLFDHFKKLIDDNKAAKLASKEEQAVMGKSPKQVFSKGNMAWICEDGSYYFLISTTKELFFARYDNTKQVLTTSMVLNDAQELVCKNDKTKKVLCTNDGKPFVC